MINEDIKFSAHALSQFSKRICVPMLESTSKIREVWSYSKEISQDTAFELTGDKAILKKENKGAKFYLVNLGQEEVLSIIKKEGNYLPLETMIGVFIVKEHNCVTFKTSLENDIWSNIQKFKPNRRYHDLA